MSYVPVLFQTQVHFILYQSIAKGHSVPEAYTLISCTPKTYSITMSSQNINLDNMYCIDLRTPKRKDNNVNMSATVDGSNYGTAEFNAPRQTFSIAEPNHSDTTPLRSNGNKRSNCCVAAAACRRCLCGNSSNSSSSSNGDGDGLKIIVISMFVFAIAVTVALVFQIASGRLTFLALII